MLNLPQDIIGLLEEEKLTAGQARPLIGLPNASEIAENIVKKKVAAREVESLVKKKKQKNLILKIPIFNLLKMKLKVNLD